MRHERSLPCWNEILPLPHNTSAARIDVSFEGCNFSSGDVSAGCIGLDKLASSSRSIIRLPPRFAMGTPSVVFVAGPSHRSMSMRSSDDDPNYPKRLVS